MTLWSVQNDQFPALSFNPNTSTSPGDPTAGGRFHPFHDADGNPVPTRYVAEASNSAFSETLLRDDNPARAVSLGAMRSNRLVLLATKRSIKLADLSHLQRTTQIGELLGNGRESYVALRNLAATVHRDTDYAGIRWNGKQLGLEGLFCCVLFGDRLDPAGDWLQPVESYALTEGEGFTRLRLAANSLGLALPSLYASGA